MRFYILGLLFLILLSAKAQQPKLPDVFLGYALGKHFTPHYKVVDYFKSVAQGCEKNVKLQNYGLTNEGKDLLIAIVSSPENINRIDEIRKNNLRMAGLLNDKPADLNMPTIVWLSYNVHGNEASSTEVAMKLLYELAAGKNQSINGWLKNVVVIIDPCLNPDGRDRYVNWYNQMVGKSPNSNPLSREHDEPWPGGRSNHYNFDLNRDWAWQTQVETQQRILKYNEWMPEIHCDFHEQYPNNPYYFAPAAEPFHEIITPWQRSFQTTIGKNHAKYFDANGWLYFTKEIFDLFYPSYGDTYPIYNGSIGMTYEQAGHSMGGLSIKVDEDTLTLYDRIAHHYTTSISTIEIASNNAKKINEEFSNYFIANKLNGSGIYKTYVIDGSNINKLNSLKLLLDKNKIEYSYSKKGVSAKGFHYLSGKEESFLIGQHDLIVSTFQPKGSLVKVLFEPQSKLSDSVTYDITAWSIPYVYGLDCYAVKEKIEGFSESLTKTVIPTNDNYAYLIEYNSFEDAKLLASMLKTGIKVKFAERDFICNEKNYKRGTLIILKNQNANKIDEVLNFSKKFNSTIQGISSGFMDTGYDFGSEKVHKIKMPTVALVTGSDVSSTAAGEVWHLFEQQLDYPIVLINSSSLANIDLKTIDVLIFPDGNYKMLTDKESAIKNWVKQGGKIIATESTVSQMAMGDWGIKQKKEDDENKSASYDDIKKYENRERQSVGANIPGAIYKLIIDDTHPLCFGYPDYYFSLKMNSNVFEFMKEGWNVGVIKQGNQISGFVGNAIKNKIKDGTVIAVQDFGSGRIVYFADNPLFRSFWENGKLMFANAVFFVGQ
jgi:hypothetical protein